MTVFNEAPEYETRGDRKRREQEKKNEAVMIGCLGLLLSLLIVVPVLTLLAWNLGIVGIVAACGGSIAGINYWTALGVSAVYLLIRSMLKVIR